MYFIIVDMLRYCLLQSFAEFGRTCDGSKYIGGGIRSSNFWCSGIKHKRSFTTLLSACLAKPEQKNKGLCCKRLF